MNNLPKLFIIIDDAKISLIAGHDNDQNSFEILEKLILPIDGVYNNYITDLDKITNLIKRNVLIIEQKVNYTFKEIVIIGQNSHLLAGSINKLLPPISDIDTPQASHRIQNPVTITIGDIMAISLRDDPCAVFAQGGIIGKWCQMMTGIYLLPILGTRNCCHFVVHKFAGANRLNMT